MNIQKLDIVSVRDAFRHEALDFTRWLEVNIDALSERVGLDLNVLEREKTVGSFSVDLFCEDSRGQYVIIENQLERTDHDHLGKLLTYLVNLDAKTAIWITPEVRPEHEWVIDWLNESTSADYAFYLVRVEAIRIADSPFAPLFTVLAGPDAQIREIGENKKELAERYVLREQFWSRLLERSKGRTTLGANRSPSRDSWFILATGRSGVTYTYQILREGMAIDLYISMPDRERNKAFFDQLYAQHSEIQKDFGELLDWRRLDDKIACRIRKTYTEYGTLSDQENWDNLIDVLIEAMIRFDKAFRHRIHAIKV